MRDRLKIRKLKSEQDVRGLIALLRDSDIRVRTETEFAILDVVAKTRGSPNPSARQALAEGVRDPTIPLEGRTRLMEIMADWYGDDAALDSLVELLDDDTREDPSDPSTSVRFASLEILPRLGERASAPLLSILGKSLGESEGGDPLRESILECLVRCADEEAVVRVLGEKGSEASLIAILGTWGLSTRASVVGELREKMRACRAAAARALGEMGGRAALEALLEVQGRPGDDLRDSPAVLQALGMVDGPLGIEAIEDALGRSDRWTSTWWDAVRILADRGSEGARRMLIEALVTLSAGGADHNQRRGAVFELEGLAWASEYLGGWALPALQEALGQRGESFSALSGLVRPPTTWDDFDYDMDEQIVRRAVEVVEDLVRRIGTPEALRILEERGRPA